MRRVAAIAATLLLGVASAVAGASGTVARPIRFDHLGNPQGLSQSTVMAVLQDSQGFMWFATEDGVNRFDGYSMKVYRRGPGTRGALASDFVWSLQEDPDGDIWMATIGGGVARWIRRLDRFELHRHDPANPDSPGSDAVRTLIVDRRGRVWAGTEKDGIAAIDRRTGESRRFRGAASGLPADAIFALHEDARGRIWIGTDAGLAVIEQPAGDRPAIRHVAELGSIRVRALASDSQGNLWIGTFDRGAVRYAEDGADRLSLRHDAARPTTLSSDHVRAILEDSERRIWIATSRGLDLLDVEERRVTRYAHDKSELGSLRDSYTMSLYQDRGGLLWVGTRAGGVSRWDPRSWQFGHTRSPSLRDVAVTGFADDGAGTVWVSTAGAGLVEMAQDDGTERRRLWTGADDARWRLPDDRVMSVLRDRRGRLWIGTMGSGVELLDRDRGRLRAFRHAPGDPYTPGADGVMTLFEARDGTIWAGTFGGGIARYDEVRGRFQAVAAGNAPGTRLSDLRASTIAEDPGGKLWVGTTGGGLNLVDPATGRVHSFASRRGVPDALGDDTIYALHVDARGTLWIGTAGGGLSRATGSVDDPGSIRFRTWGTQDGLPSNVVYGIEPDASGRLWLSTNYGLVRFDPADESVLLLHDRHGLQGEEFNFAAHHRSSGGLLFFGGNNGYNAFDPERLRLGARPPPVVMTAVETLNAPASTPVPHYLLDRFTLGHRDLVTTFEFAALDFAAPERNRYAYRLEGFDPRWIDAGNVRRVSYTNLDAGQYTFRVRAAGADGVWNEAGIALPVTVQPAPWASPAVKVVYALVVAFLLLVLLNIQRRRTQRATRYREQLAQLVEDRTRELSARNRELEILTQARSQFVARMSHELRTPMNGVIGMTEVLLNRPLDQAQRRCVEIIGRAAASLVAIVNDILDLSKAEAGRLQAECVATDVGELVESVADTFAGRALDKGIDLVVDAPSHPLPPLLVDAMRLRQVLGNLVGNAVKFTDRGHVVLTWQAVQPADGTVAATFVVGDTGVGIKAENIERIFEPFSQEDSSTQRRFGGTGLGLAIARELVELMGGRLTVASQPGVGTEFRFALGLRPVGPVTAAPAVADAFAGRRALLIGAAGPQRAVLERHLAEWGFEVTSEDRPRDTGVAAHTADLVLALRDVGAPLCARAVQLGRDLRARAFVDICDLAQATSTSESPAPDGTPLVQIVRPIRVAELRRMLCEIFGAQVADGASAAAPGAAARGASGLPFSGTVLVVEDQAINRAVARGLLGPLGFAVDEATDGHEALAALRRRTYRLVLMDCQMPLLDGLEATRRIRRGDAGDPQVPIVALTADATLATREACLAAGMDRVLTKPITQASLVGVIAELLAGRHAQSPDASAGTDATLDGAAPELLDPQALELLRGLPGGPEASGRILELYASGSTRLQAQLEAAAHAADLDAVARIAHAWKSYHGNVGARRPERLCRELEEAAQAGDREAVARLAGELSQAYTEVSGALALEFPGRAA